VRFPQLTLKKDFQQSFGRVYGDYEAAELGQFPFIAHLDLFTVDGEFVCGSSILDANTVVTAAHCVEGLNKVTVRAGTINWREPGPEAQIRESTVFGAHEDFTFDDNTVQNDIAFIKVSEEPFELGGVVDSIKVAANEPAVGSLASVIGFGATSGGLFAPASDTLNYAVDLTIVDDDEADVYTNDVIFEHFICTFQGDKGTCGGDSGGPIVDADGNLFGATSFGSGDCTIGPSCFTSLPVFRDWLIENAEVDI